jgi:short-subunit dehydrogenase
VNTVQGHQKPNTSTGRPLILVTGASTGIGLELARVFADNGFDLIITTEDDKLAAAEASLAGNGAEVRTVRADLSTYDGVARLWSAVTVGGRPPDAAALNAGIGVNGEAFLQSFAQAIRFELKDTGVTVTALQPGPTDTDFFERAGMEDTKVAEASRTSQPRWPGTA